MNVELWHNETASVHFERKPKTLQQHCKGPTLLARHVLLLKVSQVRGGAPVAQAQGITISRKCQKYRSSGGQSTAPASPRSRAGGGPPSHFRTAISTLTYSCSTLSQYWVAVRPRRAVRPRHCGRHCWPVAPPARRGARALSRRRRRRPGPPPRRGAPVADASCRHCPSHSIQARLSTSLPRGAHASRSSPDAHVGPWISGRRARLHAGGADRSVW